MIKIPDSGIRLYQGMTRTHRPELVEALSFGQGVNFTDCPRIALQFAQGARGNVIVVDAPHDARITHEIWPNPDGARRPMFWGRFEEHIVAVIPAKVAVVCAAPTSSAAPCSVGTTPQGRTSASAR